MDKQLLFLVKHRSCYSLWSLFGNRKKKTKTTYNTKNPIVIWQMDSLQRSTSPWWRPNNLCSNDLSL